MSSFFGDTEMQQVWFARLWLQIRTTKHVRIMALAFFQSCNKSELEQFASGSSTVSVKISRLLKNIYPNWNFPLTTIVNAFYSHYINYKCVNIF